MFCMICEKALAEIKISFTLNNLKTGYRRAGSVELCEDCMKETGEFMQFMDQVKALR